MSFKFAVGQDVEYSPVGSKGAACLFTVTQHMPHEDSSSHYRYRIKNSTEPFSREVFEYDLGGEIGPASSYAVPVKGRFGRS
jgi:hypothetical protein